MLGSFDFNPGPWRKPVPCEDDALPLSAKITLSVRGGKARFSDGRSVWILREPNISEATFLTSVTEWVKRRGVRSLEIVLDDDDQVELERL